MALLSEEGILNAVTHIAASSQIDVGRFRQSLLPMDAVGTQFCMFHSVFYLVEPFMRQGHRQDLEVAVVCLRRYF